VADAPFQVTLEFAGFVCLLRQYLYLIHFGSQGFLVAPVRLSTCCRLVMTDESNTTTPTTTVENSIQKVISVA
jgi:hypothetical protein